MKITKSALENAVAKNLPAGKRVNSAEVRGILAKAGVDLRYKGAVRESQVKTAFEALKKEKMLKARASGEGINAFKGVVKKEVDLEANPGLSKERQQAHAKALLRERLDEEAAKKQKITEALAPRKGAPAAKDKTSSASTARPAMGGVVVPESRGAATAKPVMSSLGGGPSFRAGSIGKNEPEKEKPLPDIFGPED